MIVEHFPIVPFHVTALLILLFAFGSSARAAELTVRLAAPPSTGTVAFLLFDSANAFSDLREPTRVVREPLDGRDVYRIENIAPGEYALLVYYDENNNERIDKNFIGIPKEPLGFSNGYHPKGPPDYSRAAFVLTENESRQFDVTLRRPLGKLGRLGVGVGVIAQSSPYRGYSGGVYQFIPAITYTGTRLQIYGPNLQLALIGSGKLRLAATGHYRIGAYEEDESDFLRGMDDCEDTFMVGLALQAELPGGFDLSAGYAHDALDRIGGGEASLRLDKSLQVGIFRVSPQVGLNWISADMANNDFGVPPEKAIQDRPAYALDAVLDIEAGMGIFFSIGDNGMVIVNISAELLNGEITDSPIVDKDYVIKGFSAFSYVF